MQAQSIARFGGKSNADLTLVFQTMLAAPIRKVQIRLEKAQGDLTRFLDIAEPPL